MRKHFKKLIDNEIKNARSGLEARITIKINTLVDKDIINKLYQASGAGVQIVLIVRGACSLIPGIAGMSENIRAVSIVDKFLEHSRVLIRITSYNVCYTKLLRIFILFSKPNNRLLQRYCRQ